MGSRAMITIFIPVSRDNLLDKLFARLEILECNSETTNLFVYVDGDMRLYTRVQNFVANSKFAQRLCVQRKSPIKQTKYSIERRRVRIANIYNEAKQYLQEAEYIFGIEDDTIVPTNALKKLLTTYQIRPYAGFVSGWELGRWGTPYVGA